MDGELIETFCDEIKETLFDIATDLLKTENYQVFIEPLLTEGLSRLIFVSAILNIKSLFGTLHHFNLLVENLIGVVYRVQIKTIDGSQTTSLFLKVAPVNELRRSLLQIHETFVREAYVYDVVIS